MYDAAEHVILDQSRMAFLDKEIEKQVDSYFEAGKAGKAVWQEFGLL